MTGPPISIDSLLGPSAPARQGQAPAVNLDDLLGASSVTSEIEQKVLAAHPEILQLPVERRRSAVQDVVTDESLIANHPLMKALPREVRVGLAQGGREVVGGAVEFFKKFIYSPPSLERLRSDLANFDTYQPVLTGAGQEIGRSPKETYGS